MMVVAMFSNMVAEESGRVEVVTCNNILEVEVICGNGDM